MGLLMSRSEARQMLAENEELDLIWDTTERAKICTLIRHGILTDEQVGSPDFNKTEKELYNMLLENDICYEDIFE
jgi:hypothetical protein